MAWYWKAAFFLGGISVVRLLIWWALRIMRSATEIRD